MVQVRGREAAMALLWEGLKKLLMEEYLSHMVTPKSKHIDRYIWGLAPAIRGTMETSPGRAFSIAANEAQQDLNVVTSLPISREAEFRIDLIPGAMPVGKSPYRLAPMLSPKTLDLLP
ncbi:hypothetical protein Tco_0655665 [Tanacetum coccineum]|uniref:Reverse transcriptase domain-containing protein n=1 Tax=Tanacetum coccineum TaxID=301880 RepID=A0ABQ4X6M7_9ASTR